MLTLGQHFLEKFKRNIFEFSNSFFRKRSTYWKYGALRYNLSHFNHVQVLTFSVSLWSFYFPCLHVEDKTAISMVVIKTNPGSHWVDNPRSANTSPDRIGVSLS